MADGDRGLGPVGVWTDPDPLPVDEDDFRHTQLPEMNGRSGPGRTGADNSDIGVNRIRPVCPNHLLPTSFISSRDNPTTAWLRVYEGWALFIPRQRTRSGNALRHTLRYSRSMTGNRSSCVDSNAMVVARPRSLLCQ